MLVHALLPPLSPTAAPEFVPLPTEIYEEERQRAAQALEERAETLRKLENDTGGTNESRDPLSVLLTLGELWWVGLTGLLVDLTGTAIPPDAGGGGDPHDRRR